MSGVRAKGGEKRKKKKTPIDSEKHDAKKKAKEGRREGGSECSSRDVERGMTEERGRMVREKEEGDTGCTHIRTHD